MSKYVINGSTLTDIADAIRSKTSDSALIQPENMDDEISSITGGGATVDPFALTDYIESSGTQWIDTGYTPNENSEFELVANVNSNNYRYATLFGSRVSDFNKEVLIFAKSNDNNFVMYSWGGNSANYQVFVYNVLSFYDSKALFKLSSDKIVLENIDNETISINTIGINSNVDNGTNIFLFNLNQGGVEYGMVTRCIMKMYRFRIKENGIVVHDFIPWADTNDVVCLKDTVTGNIKYNQGTGVFTRGTDS